MNVATAWERSPVSAAAGTWGEAEAWGRRRPTSSWEETELLRGTLSRPAGTKDSAAARGHSGTEPALAQLQGSHQGDFFFLLLLENLRAVTINDREAGMVLPVKLATVRCSHTRVLPQN